MDFSLKMQQLRPDRRDGNVFAPLVFSMAADPLGALACAVQPCAEWRNGEKANLIA